MIMLKEELRSNYSLASQISTGRGAGNITDGDNEDDNFDDYLGENTADETVIEVATSVGLRNIHRYLYV